MTRRYTGGFLSATEQVTDANTANGIFSVQDAGALTSSGSFPTGRWTPQRSLRLRRSASAYLNRTPAAASNRKTWTWSAWVKKCEPAENATLFAARTSSGATYLTFVLSSVGDFRMESNSETAYPLYKTNALFRDPAAWYHIVVALDTTQAVSTNRLKVYVNGNLQTTASYNVPAQNTDLALNSTETHLIGQQAGGNYADAYITEYNLIDGQALDPSYFGATDPETGVWVPKKPSLPVNSILYPVTGSMLSQSGLQSFTAATVVDGDLTTNAYYTDTSAAGSYLKVDLGASNTQDFNKVIMYANSGGTVQAVWDIQYSDDNSNWTTAYTGISQITGSTVTPWVSATWASVGAHRYWRLYKTNAASGGNWTTEVQFYTTDTSGYGINGFYLPFSDNTSATNLALDKSNPVYSANLRSSGTNIGTYTSNGGLAAAFDGNLNQANAASAKVVTPAAGYNTATLGKDWGSGVTKTITAVRIKAQNDGGFAGGTNVPQSFKIQGSQDNSTWTDLYTGGTSGATAELVKVTSLIQTTAYRYHRVNFNANGADNYYICELEFYEAGTGGLNNWTPNNITVSGTTSTTVSFTTVGTTSWTAPMNVSSVNYLVVAGGGGGGSGQGGGGGAGGMRTGTLSVSPGTIYTMTVGAGGTAGSAGTDGNNGSDSVFSTITSTGGGGGVAATTLNGKSGGSGGGASDTYNSSGGTGGAALPITSPVQGYAGGNGSSVGVGGGGGAGAVGGNASSYAAGAGGAGVASSISGSSVTYAGGGGGGGLTGLAQTAASGGAGGGGAGSTSTGTAGTANTGGGGGGGGSIAGGAGGSGIIILSYSTADSTYDSMVDVPGIASSSSTYDIGGTVRGNYAVQNPLYPGSSTLSNANLQSTSAGATVLQSASTFSVDSGKWYWEVTVTTIQTGNQYPFVGAYRGIPVTLTGAYRPGADTGVNGFSYRQSGPSYVDGTQIATWGSMANGDVLGFALDLTNLQVSVYKNNTLQGTITGLVAGAYTPADSEYSGSVVNYNYGQRPFKYVPPVGFKSLNTTNLPNPIIKRPSDHFDVKTYVGNGSALQVGTTQKQASTYGINKSLRLRGSATGYLSRIAGTSTSARKGTISMWVKRTTISSTNTQYLFQSSYNAAPYRDNHIGFTSANKLEVYFSYQTSVGGGWSDQIYLATNDTFVNTSNWYHIVFQWDTTQISSRERAKLYVNGTRVTSFSSATYPTLNQDLYVDTTGYTNFIGTSNGGGVFLQVSPFDGYIAEYNRIDGQSFDASTFGAFDANNNWMPKAYTGTYGNNGFYLPFNANAPDSSAVDVLVVAGGGGGGSTAGGGGGAGGFREATLAIVPSTAYTVTVGAGSPQDTAGNNSVFSTITSAGGGKGGAFLGGGTTTAANSAGGSGGGAGGRGLANNTQPGGTATVYQGNDGGGSLTSSYGGGGGGGGAGGVGSTGGYGGGGAGGSGKVSSITGSTYAGGGGGGIDNGIGSYGSAGSGGGGAGGGPGGSGTANTGGGGGGGSNPSGAAGGTGGSGIVVLKYPDTRTITIGSGLTGSTGSPSGGFKVTTITAGTGTVSFA